MNILALNQPYLSQAGFREVFEAKGHRTVSIGWNAEGCDIICRSPVVTLDELISLLPSGFIPDRIVLFDSSNPPRVLGLESSPVPTIVHLVDVHIHRSWHRLWAGAFDYGLIAMKGYMHLFPPGADTPPMEWFPLWTFEVGPTPDAPRAVAASFRGTIGGTHPKRLDFLSSVNAQTPVDFGSGPFRDLYGRSKIILNDCISDDLNWRVFEALASGAMLLTPRVSPETLELFPEGEALVTYEAHNAADAAAKIEFYLRNSSERLRIARNGYSKVQELHTARHRAEALLRVVEQVTRRSTTRKRFSAAATYLKIPTVFPNFDSALFLQAALHATEGLSKDSSLPHEESIAQQNVLMELFEHVRREFENLQRNHEPRFLATTKQQEPLDHSK